MLKRSNHRQSLVTALGRSPVTALVGPRQCGKTTLARMVASGRQSTYYDLEAPTDRQRLQNPELVLGESPGLVVLDEIQSMPELFAVLRVLVDRGDRPGRFLILGSASAAISRDVAESLAGRVEFVELSGFDLSETGASQLQTLWVRGGFPRSYLAASEADSAAWREGFIRTFLERDIPQLGITIPAAAMRRFWTMLAHAHGQTWNASELARSMGLSDKTVRSYLDILTGTFMVRQLQPWFENLKKRQVKSPKVYLRDSGLLHGLLQISDRDQLLGHPRLGASWEGFVVEQVLARLGFPEAYFWATHKGAELDLLFFAGGKRFGVECKFTEAPRVTRSMHTALEDLSLEHLWVVHPGKDEYRAHERITMLPLDALYRKPADPLSW